MENQEMTEENKAPYFESLTRNLHGGIDGVYFNGQFPEGIPYTLDPAMGHIEKAEAGEWGSIKELSKAKKDAHEAEQARKETNQEALAYLQSTDWYVLRQMDSGEPIPEDVGTLRAEARARIV